MVATTCSAEPSTPTEARLSVAEVFRRFGPRYLRRVVLTAEQAKVLRSLIVCRTAALGGHIDTCERCDASWTTYNSCRDRHCPTCQGGRAKQWMDQRLDRLVQTHHFHVVATVPEQLRPLALANQRVVYDLLFAAVSETLLQLAADRWEALPAITAVLHTWTRMMAYHPHVHCIVSGGGLSLDGSRWSACKTDFLFPVRVMSALIRGKFMAGLVRAYERGELRFTGGCAQLRDACAFSALRQELYEAQWVVYSKPPFGDVTALVRYLSLYTHRVAISSSRLLSVDDDTIVFRTRSSGTCTVTPDEFIRRFLLHVLPEGFRKIRHYGLLAPSNVSTRLPIAQRLASLGSPARRRSLPQSPSMSTQRVLGGLCPLCGCGHLVRWSIPSTRAPPEAP